MGGPVARGKMSNFGGKKAGPFKGKGKKRPAGTAKPKAKSSK
jgi:hypothetical protein